MIQLFEPTSEQISWLKETAKTKQEWNEPDAAYDSLSTKICIKYKDKFVGFVQFLPCNIVNGLFMDDTVSGGLKEEIWLALLKELQDSVKNNGVLVWSVKKEAEAVNDILFKESKLDDGSVKRMNDRKFNTWRVG